MSAPNVKKFPRIKALDERKSILQDPETGDPVGIEADLIPSETTPGRYRVAFALPVEIEEDGETQDARVLISPPFRIEMN